MQQPYSAKDHLPLELYRAADVRDLDRVVIEHQGIPAFDLMVRAGEAAFASLLGYWSDAEKICVFAGRGNNGGDAYVVAALAIQHGMEVCFYAVGDHGKLSPEAAAAKTMASEAGVVVQSWQGDISCDSDIYIDGLLGTGLTGDVSGEYLQAIEMINQQSREPLGQSKVMALDIPSGLCADTGRILGAAINADLTVSFIGMKQGMLTGQGPDVCGRIAFADLGTAKTSRQQIEAGCQRISWSVLEKQQSDRLPNLLAHRLGSAHKGHHGHVLVVGGDHGTAGAAMMASQSALRTGAGLVSSLTQPEHVSASLAACPEVMVAGIQSGLEMDQGLAKADVIVVGPGLGQRSWGQLLLQRIITELQTDAVDGSSSIKALVLDADALNLLERFPQINNVRVPIIMTPHPGEAARLLHCSVKDIERDRFAAAQTLAKKYNAVIILKGQGTLISDGEQTLVCSDGNPGMATGGMGDILAGVLGALLAQGLPAIDAAILGVCVHSGAADVACDENGQVGLMATDLLPYIRQLVQQQ